MNEARPDNVPLNKEWSRVYDPRRTKVGHRDVMSPGQIGEKGAAYSTPVQGAPDKANPSSVPYYEVYSSYSREAEKALDKEDIPPAYRKQVRDYFNSLKP